MNFKPPHRRKFSHTNYLNTFQIYLSQNKSKLIKNDPLKKEESSIINKSKDSKDSKISLTLLNNGIASKLFDYKIQFSFKVIVQYAREKIKRQYKTPYILKLVFNKKNNILKDDEKPIYYFLYKINDIFLNKKSRFSVHFYECNILYNENEFFIKYFKRFEINVMMRYLLAFVYDKDIYSHFSKEEYRHKNKSVLRKFQYMVNNNYVYDNYDNELENISSERWLKIHRRYIPTFKNSINQKISPFFLKRKNLLFLYEYETSYKNKTREDLFSKVPKYYFIKDVPFQKVPNCVQNFYSLGYFMNSLLEKYLFYKKFSTYKEEKPKKIKSQHNLDINIESLDDLNAKNKKEISDSEKTSSSLSDSHSQKFLNEIDFSSSSSSRIIFNKNANKKTNKRASIFNIKDKKFKKKNFEDNEIVNLEKLIKNMEMKKKDSIILEARPSMKSTFRKKLKKRILVSKPTINEFFISYPDNFEIKNAYDEKTNFIQRTFNKKLTSKNINESFKQKEIIPKLLLNSNNNAVNYSLSFNNKNKFNRSSKYTNTTTGISNIKRISMEKKYIDNYISNNTKRNFHLSSKNNLQKFKLINNFKYYSNFNFYGKEIDKNDYPHNFKNKGKLIKQRKITLSFIHNIHKIAFKDTSDFINGIKQSDKNKKYQRDLLKDIMTNYGLIYQKRNKTKNKYKFFNNTNFLHLKKNKINTVSFNSKYKNNVSKDNSTKNSIYLNKNEIFRDCIDLNGIFKHTKINM